MAPNINNPGGVKNDPDEIRDGVVSDATRFPGGFIDQQITQAGAPLGVAGRFELSTASFILSFDTSQQTGNPLGVTFDTDGDRLYVSGGAAGKVFQYSLSTGFDVSSASFSQSFDVSTQDGSPQEIAFSPDGTKMIMVGRFNVKVFEYSLSTPFDISTASFDQSFDVSTQTSNPTGLAVNPDGGQIYVTGTINENIYQYGLSTSFDVSTASFTQSFDVSSQDGSPQGVTFDSDGGRMYITGGLNLNVFQYSLSTPFDISTASFIQALDISAQQSSPRGLAFGSSGSQLYVAGLSPSTVSQYAVGNVGGELG